MSEAVIKRLADAGWRLPKASAPAGDYVAFTIAGDLLTVSGQLPFDQKGELRYVGRLGEDFGVEEGQAAATLCALNVVAQFAAAVDGDLDRIARVARIGVFVHATPAFGDHPKVANGASAVMATAFGDAGKHARAAVGCVSLPFGVAVEVEATAQLR